ncbi:MAG: phosphoglycerate kinase [Actinobacteria bacterium]|nr:phosphoglycerate kinase [Actinomycetota bacterium]
MRTLDSISFAGKHVLLRADFNVPIESGEISDDGRIQAAIPTLSEILNQNPASILITAHLGRPDGVVDQTYSLAPVVNRLSKLLKKPVNLLAHQDLFSMLSQQELSGIYVLENIRFDPRETSKSESERIQLAKELTRLADVFVSDGFGVVHRKQASVYDVAKFVPAVAGRLIEREIEVFNRVLNNPSRPYTVILGGAKVADKIKVVDNLIQQADSLLIGGGMAYTFLHAMGFEVGDSLLDLDSIEAVKSSIEKAEANQVDLIVPVDVVVSREFSDSAERKILDADAIETGWMGLDIGPKTQKLFADQIAKSATVVWNGPVGVFEMLPFSEGTKSVAYAIVECSGFTVIGGGDSAAAIRALGLSENLFDHVSTGGGASLEYLEGKQLPGLMCLMEDM